MPEDTEEETVMSTINPNAMEDHVVNWNHTVLDILHQNMSKGNHFHDKKSSRGKMFHSSIVGSNHVVKSETVDASMDVTKSQKETSSISHPSKPEGIKFPY